MGLSVPEPFTDPLSAVLPDGGERARTRLRLAGALLFAAGSLTLAAVLAAPDPDALIAATAHDAVKIALREATEAAWELGVQGVPTLEAGRRLYFGDDRLEEAARSG